MASLSFLAMCLWFFPGADIFAQEPIELTLESALDIAMKNSYRIRRLELGIERTRLLLKARRARLKSSVSMDLKAPRFEALSDYKWNSTLKRDELIRQNTGLWEMELSVSQPIILFGHPTNGYLSLNSKTYRYSQKEDGTNALNYYTRYYVRFKQPLFQPNFLRNDIEEAELDLDRRNLEYIADQVDLIDDVADDYYDLFQLSYRSMIYSNHITNLKETLEIAETVEQQDTAPSGVPVQVQVEVANAREQLLRNQSRYRMEVERLKQRLRLHNGEVLNLTPAISISPIAVDPEQAVRYGLSLRPRLRVLQIRKQKDEIDLNNTRGRNAFHIDLEMTYGIEKQDEAFSDLWERYDNSYSVSLNAYIPLWDWGRRKALIDADRISIRRAELAIEEVGAAIASEIASVVENLQEYQRRATRMKDNLDKSKRITRMGIEQYRRNRIPLQDLLRSISIQRETELNFLHAYMGYRRSILSLMINTYYDFENDVSLLDRFLHPAG